MAACPSCGNEVAEGFRFCPHCGAPLAAAAPERREVRKTVTVVFADVTGSTALGERLDPESLRKVMSRYFEAVRAVLERHGGTVEKFIGDAVMAVFGIPTLHEDDALRAVRAAAEMGEALSDLNRELERDHGVTLAMRTGVNTGEVVAGDPAAGQALVTGDAVNTAARLEQAAQPGEVLIGDVTYRLVRDAVKVEAVEPVAAKGKAQPVPAYRLLEVLPGAPAFARRLDSPLVGRRRELDLLGLAFDRAVEEASCHLVTILGSAGVGKSRLVEEFLAHVADRATVLRGRCLPYGEGITFWPVVEVMRQAAGIADTDTAEAARAKLDSLVGGEEGSELVARRVAQVIGLTADSAVPEETFWAIRKLLESVARRGPLAVVFDDVHWAEPTFLDLVEHVADWSRDAPILLACLARQELLDARPGWGGGKVNATTMLLGPLSDAECEELVRNLLGRAELSEEARSRITEAAEGNPLFVEEMLSMLIDDGLLRRDDGHWVATGDLTSVSVPPTIQALLASRLDRLDGEERAALERASAIGRVFYRGAVSEMSPEAARSSLGTHLMGLVRRELIRPHASEFAAEETYRFRHLLVRDAAYESMPKQSRAELHQRFADWLERAARDRIAEYEEILAYHLGQAHRYLGELGPLDDHGRRLGERAGRVLASAGGRALARGDSRGASSILARAVALLPADDPERLVLLPDLARVRQDAGDLSGARAAVAEALALGAVAEDRSVEVRARAVGVILDATTATGRSFAELLAEAERLTATAEEIGDIPAHLGALRVLAVMRFWSGDSAGALEAADRGIELATRTGLPELLREVRDLRRAVWSSTVWGSMPADEGLRRWTALLEESRGTSLEAWSWGALSFLHAMTGSAQQARTYLERTRSLLAEYGLVVNLANAQLDAAVAILLGDPAPAVERLRAGVETLRSLGETGFLSTTAANLGELCYQLGQDEEAEAASRLSEEAAAVDDVSSQVGWRSVRAKVLARRGEHGAAERLAREAAEMSSRTDHLFQRGKSLEDLAEVLRIVGKPDEAAATLEEAIRVYDRKGNVVMAERARASLEEIEPHG